MEKSSFQNQALPITILVLVVVLNITLGINLIATSNGYPGIYLTGMTLYILLGLESMAVVGAWLSGRKKQTTVAF